MADLAVIHGGIGTVMTAVLASKPVVGVGIQMEQVANLACLERLGSRFESESHGTRPEKFRKPFGSCWATKVPKKRPLPLPKQSRDGMGPSWRLRGYMSIMATRVHSC